VASDALPDPAVSAEAYDTHYYLNWNAGSQEWAASEGQRVNPMYLGSLRKAKLRAGEVVVDIGTGRGELIAVAVEQGAARAVGIEYSADAVELARQTLRVHEVEDRGEVLLADARSIPLDDEMADLVTMLDVVEHLTPDELHRSLCEARRLLRPGGRLLIHTLPTRTIRRVYALQRALVPGRRRRWPADPRNEFEIRMHVNEQTVRTMRSALRRAGFEADVHLGEWIHDAYVPDSDPKARRLYHRMAKFRPTRAFGIADLWAIGRRASR
jgi:cyclopropane fatty-acyl-phospholipid synthase-like methyltransferase